MFQLHRCFLVVLALALLAVPAFAGEMQATITKVSDDSVTVTDNELQGWQFKVDELTQVLINGKEAKFSDLKPGDTVAIEFADEQEDSPRAIEIRLDRK